MLVGHVTVEHMLAAALHFRTCAQVKQVELVNHSPVSVSGLGTPGTEGGWLSNQFLGHC